MAGVAHTGTKFSNTVYNELKSKGFQVVPVNPNAENISGERCYPDIKSLPEKASAVLVITKPAQTEKIGRDAFELGIKHLWLQQGAESRKRQSIFATPSK